MTKASLTKRNREPEALLDSIDVREPKRFHGEETDWFLHLLQLNQTLADEEEEDFAPSEELVNKVMRSLEDEIATTCSTYSSSDSGDNTAATDISSGYEGQTPDSNRSGVDLCYLLEASDDELGIPLNPVLDIMDEVCQSSKETSETLRENPDVKSFGVNWDFEDNFENCQQFSLYNNAWDTIQLEDNLKNDFVSQAMLFHGDFSSSWSLDTTVSM